MTDKAEDVIVRLRRGLVVWSTTPMVYEAVEAAIATITAQAAEIETLKEQLRIERNKTEFWKYPGGRCHICGLKHGGLQCPNLTPMSSGDTP